MASYLKKKKVKEALQKAKELEKHQPMSKEQVIDIYKEGISFGEKIKSFLTPSWFVSDVDSPAVKKAKKQKIPSIKKCVKKRTGTLQRKSALSSKKSKIRRKKRK